MAVHRVVDRIIVVGDVHGCLSELQELVEQACMYNPAKDMVIVAGDLVGKGPQPKEVLQYLRRIQARSVLGNHDLLLIRWHAGVEKLKAEYEGIIPPERLAELEKKLNIAPDYVQIANTLDSEDWQHLLSLPLYIVLTTAEYPILTRDVVVVHAGFVPGVPLDQQKPWDMTHMRNVLPNGTATSSAQEGVAWASQWTGPQEVIFGHDAIRGLQQTPFAIGLDTGCCYGGWLTAYILPEKKLVQVKAKRMYSRPNVPIPNSVLESAAK